MAGKSKIGVSLPMLNQPYAHYPELARLADEAGLDSVWDYEFFRNPFITHGLTAQATERITLATGIATGVSRTPFEMANAAADIDELSDGRALIGMSTGAGSWTDVFNGAEIDRPLSRMREYVEVMRAIWKHFQDDEPFLYEGRFYKTGSPMINPWGTRDLVRPQIPIYLACLKERMLQMAGEVADGVLGYFNTPSFVTDHVRPNVAKGATTVGRDPAEVEIAALVLCSIADDREQAKRLARINVGNYVAFPVSSTAIEFMGLEEDRDHVVQKLFTEGVAALETAASDALIDTFCIWGTPDEAREKLGAYDGVLDHIVLHTPYVPPISREESDAAFRATVSTFAR